MVWRWRAERGSWEKVFGTGRGGGVVVVGVDQRVITMYQRSQRVVYMQTYTSENRKFGSNHQTTKMRKIETM